MSLTDGQMLTHSAESAEKFGRRISADKDVLIGPGYRESGENAGVGV
jgi:hypothetical protein